MHSILSDTFIKGSLILFSAVIPLTTSYHRTRQRDRPAFSPQHAIKPWNRKALRQTAFNHMVDQHRMRIGRCITQLEADKTSRDQETTTLLANLYDSFLDRERRRDEEFQDSHVARLVAFAKSRERFTIAQNTRQQAFDVAFKSWESRLEESQGFHDDILGKQAESWENVLKEAFLKGKGRAEREKVHLQYMYNKSHKARMEKLKGFKENQVLWPVERIRNDASYMEDSLSQQETDEEEDSLSQQESDEEEEEMRKGIHDNSQTDEGSPGPLGSEKDTEETDGLERHLSHDLLAKGDTLPSQTTYHPQPPANVIIHDVDSSTHAEEDIRHTDFAAMIVEETQRWTNAMANSAGQEELRERRYERTMERCWDSFYRRRRLEDQPTEAEDDYRSNLFDVACIERFQEQQLYFRTQHFGLLAADTKRWEEKIRDHTQHFDMIKNRIRLQWIQYFQLVRDMLDIEFEKLLDRYEPISRIESAAPAIARRTSRKPEELRPELYERLRLSNLTIDRAASEPTSPAEKNGNPTTPNSSPIIDTSNLDRDLEFLFPGVWAKLHPTSGSDIGDKTVEPAAPAEVPLSGQLPTVTHPNVLARDNLVSDDEKITPVASVEVPASVQLSIATVNPMEQETNDWWKTVRSRLALFNPSRISNAIIGRSSHLFRFLNEIRAEWIFQVSQAQRSTLVDRHGKFIEQCLDHQEVNFRQGFVSACDRRQDQALQLENRREEKFRSYQKKRQHKFAEQEDRRVTEASEQDETFKSNQGSRERLFHRHLDEIHALVNQKRDLRDWIDELVREQNIKYEKDEQRRNSQIDDLVARLIAERKERAKRGRGRGKL